MQDGLYTSQQRIRHTVRGELGEGFEVCVLLSISCWSMTCLSQDKVRFPIISTCSCEIGCRDRHGCDMSQEPDSLGT